MPKAGQSATRSRRPRSIRAVFTIRSRRSKSSRRLPMPSSMRPSCLAVKLGVDPRHGDQMVRGVTPLPHGSGRSAAWPSLRGRTRRRGGSRRRCRRCRDLVAAIQAGADKEFDVFLATPDVMGIVGRLGRDAHSACQTEGGHRHPGYRARRA